MAMFARLVGLRRRAERKELELTIENSNLSPAQIATANKALTILGFDARAQELTKQDFLIFLYAMGLNPTDDIIDSKIRALKLHHKRTFTFGQLAHVWYLMLQDLTDEEEILRRAFQFFDKDGNGEISMQELKTTMHELGDLLTEEEMTAFMAIMDINQDGRIEYTEFLAALKTQAPGLEGANRLPAKVAPLVRAGAHHYSGPPIPTPASPQNGVSHPAEPLPLLTPSAAEPHAAKPSYTADTGLSESVTGQSALCSSGVSSPRGRASLTSAETFVTATSEAPPTAFEAEAPPLLHAPPHGRRPDAGQHSPADSAASASSRAEEAGAAELGEGQAAEQVRGQEAVGAGDRLRAPSALVGSPGASPSLPPLPR